ncbi:unnamed protein product [Caenorhabditis auriculariae]|uniref:Protein kinase domain-containing protein n=1 Tax=Caenorhabditis auriculariae TaxID=2777116 RepID=A0A8S1GPD6_9PELO|nr:unnamed protein product [Caenorhabditis auriculariae]
MPNLEQSPNTKKGTKRGGACLAAVAVDAQSAPRFVWQRRDAMRLIVWPGLLQTFLLWRTTETLRLEECETGPLGMASGDIDDFQITASSSFDRQSVGPQNARLNAEMASGAWCPKPQINSKSYEFLQVNLNHTFLITAVETQGRYGNGTGREYASEYMIDYLRPDSQWIRYKNRTGHTMMTGNSDTTTAVLRKLDPPIVASRIRIVPHSKQTRTVCLRAEVHGCFYSDGLMYYTTVPEGSRQDQLDFKDPIFEDSDLYTETGTRRGLGLLSDGYAEAESPFSEEKAVASWIGWNKHHTDGVINLLFEFDRVHNFSDVVLAAFGQRIDQIDVIFSQDGKNFPLSSQISSSERVVNSTERRYDFRVPLHKRAGKKFIDFITMTPSNASLEVLRINEIGQDDRQRILLLAGIALIILFLALVLCITFCLRQKGKDEKKELREEVMKRDLIITHIGNKPSCHVFPSSHLTLDQNKSLMGNMYSSQKTTSTSISSKSSLSQKHSPPTWNDFNFPPPPPADFSAIEDRIYADPCVTLPLLPPHRKPPLNNTPTKSKTLSAKPKKEQGKINGPMSAEDSLERVAKFTRGSLLVGDDIGEGKFTVVKECIMPGGYRSAHKSVKDPSSAHGRHALMDEIRTLAVCGRHPRIVELLAVDENSNPILEYMELGDVKNFLKTTPEVIDMSTIVSIWLDVCSGMSHLENLGLVHGHLTPHNILLDENLRAKVSSPRGPAHHAQLRYSAPESILANEFSSRSDVWAFAVCVWDLANGCRLIPFERLSNAQLVDNAAAVMENREDAVALRFPETLAPQVVEVMTSCFSALPSDRPNFYAISRCISSSRSS